MIENIELTEVPYVDGLPTDKQFKISWITNGECLDGSDTKNGNTGSLNRASTQIQKNIVQLEANDFEVEGKINEVIELINTHDNVLKDIQNGEVLETLDTLSTEVGELKTEQETLASALEDTSFLAASLASEVGEYNPSVDPDFMTLRDNVVFIKTILGNEENESFNGTYQDGNPASGIKKNIIDMSKAINTNKKNISDIVEALEHVNIAESKKELEDIRTELGLSTAAKPTSVYSRLDKLETSTDEMGQKISSLEEAVTTGKVAEDIKTLESKQKEHDLFITKAESEFTNIDSKIGAEDKPGTILGNISANTSEISKQKNDIQANKSDITALETYVGTQANEPGSLSGKLSILTETVNDLSQDVQEAKLDIGDASSGIKGAITIIGTTLDGTDPAGQTVEEIGVTKATEIAYEYSKTGVPADPKNDGCYILNNGTWKSLPSSVGVFYKNNVSITTTADYQEILTPDSYIADRCSYDNGISINDPGIYEIKVISVNDASSVKNVKFQIKAETISEGGTQHLDTIILEDILKVKDKVQIFVKSTDDNFGEFVSPQIKVQIKPIR